jgi:hypothetical protein
MAKTSKPISPWVSAIGFTTILFLICATPAFIYLGTGSKHDWLLFTTLGLFIAGFIAVVFLIVYQSIYGDIEKSVLWKRIFGK